MTRRLLLLIGLFSAGCSVPGNYTNLDGPRYTGCGADTTISWNPRTGEMVSGSDTLRHSPPFNPELRVASFNIKFAIHVDEAIELLKSEPHLRNADILLLQEMDEPGVKKIAGALGYCWVYYPATLHPQSERQFGNAILSRYPFREDHKVRFPHLGQFGKTQRIAAAATIDVNGAAVRIYSVHLATIVELGPKRRRDQAQAVVEDASHFQGPVLIGGDLNQKGIGQVFADAGYSWITEALGHTTKYAALDHFLLRGLKPEGPGSVGKILDAGAASDHVPIWAALRVSPPDH